MASIDLLSEDSLRSDIVHALTAIGVGLLAIGTLNALSIHPAVVLVIAVLATYGTTLLFQRAE